MGLSYLEVLMKATRLLLPFIHGVEMRILEYGVLMAKSHDATIVPLSFIYVPEKQWGKGTRLEHIQQSKDFLEAVRVIAARHNVPVERYEVETGDVVRSIEILTEQLACDGMILFVRGSDGVLLNTPEVALLIKQAACPLYLIRLPARRSRRLAQQLRDLLLHWFSDKSKQGEISEQTQLFPTGVVEQEEIISPDSASLLSSHQQGLD
jgi:hypothetical protein